MIKSGKLLLTAILLATGCSSEAQQNSDREMYIQELLAAPNPLEDTIELGRKMVEFRAQYTANAIRTSIANK
jgi:hypothetical protein